jgi:tetraacyldisaccharide 4'-kinase
MPRLPGWWLHESVPGRLLAPLGWLFAAAVTLRRRAYERRWLASRRLPVPVVVVGNIFVGGTGKTPFVVWLVDELRRRGWRPGIVCRGYGGGSRSWPRRVRPECPAEEVGDEPVLLARRSEVPVYAGPDRFAAGQALLAANDCDILVLDDGLQHYRLQRDREIVIMDGRRGLGNGRCLPAGPLREPARRLSGVDLVLFSAPASTSTPGFDLQGSLLRAVDGSDRQRPLAELAGTTVHAVAGIGHPERFFDQLERAGLAVIPHPFPDHHPYNASDLRFSEAHPIVMTEKDAVKCRGAATAATWYLEVSATLNEAAETAVGNMLDTLSGAGEGR